VAVLDKNKRRQDIFFILGGLCMEAYSIYLKDMLFIILQLIFIISAVYDLFRRR